MVELVETTAGGENGRCTVGGEGGAPVGGGEKTKVKKSGVTVGALAVVNVVYPVFEDNY